MSAAKVNQVIEQGVTVNQVITVKQTNGAYLDLTGYSARMQIRESSASAEVILDQTSSIIGGQGLVLGGAAGTITVQIPAATTAALSFYVVDYDLEIVSPGGAVTRVVQGKCTLSHEVTK